MNYFRYQYQGSMAPIWSLFTGLKDAQTENLETSGKKFGRCEYGHTVDIINSAMRGNLVDNLDYFDLRSYEFACQKNESIEKDKSREKILSIVEQDEEEENGKVKYGEVSSNRLKKIEEAYELLEENEQFEKCMKELLSIRSEYIIEQGIDPFEMVKNALRGIPSAISELKESTDSRLKELVVDLCESSRDGYLQQRLELV